MIDHDRLLNGPAMLIYGRPITYAPRSGVTFSTTGIFDRRYVEIGFGEDGQAISAMRTTLRVRKVDMLDTIPSEQGDTVFVGADQYRVIDVQEDPIDAYDLVLGARVAGP